jgi:hypothetical protein
VPGRGAAVTGAAPAIELDPDCIQLTALLPHPVGYDLRFLNASDAAQDARVRLQPQPADVTVVTLGGIVGDRLVPRDGAFRIAVRPWEIVTLRVTR